MHAVATIRMDQERSSRFFCDQNSKECKPLDVSFAKHVEAAKSDDGSYIWEYVATCTGEKQPCNEKDSPSILLRRCPAGSVLINTTQSGQFQASLQECLPCGPGFYIVDPMYGPCIKCPEGAECPGFPMSVSLPPPFLLPTHVELICWGLVYTQTARSLCQKLQAQSGQGKFRPKDKRCAYQNVLQATPCYASRTTRKVILVCSVPGAVKTVTLCNQQDGLEMKAIQDWTSSASRVHNQAQVSCALQVRP